MKTEAQKVADYRKRLADRKANWLIDITGKKTVSLVLTSPQQELLRKATHQDFSSVTLIFQAGATAAPVRTALCNLISDASEGPEKPQTRKANSRPVRKATGTRASR
jgi:hypothetical protein